MRGTDPKHTLTKENYSPDWPQTLCVAEEDLEILNLLPLLPTCWDYEYVPPTSAWYKGFISGQCRC